MAKRLTRHNGRAGKSGVYKSTHNDRTFDTEHADHIDGERIQQNIYWDCFRGATYPAQQDGEVSFADVERAFSTRITLTGSISGTQNAATLSVTGA